MSKTQDLWREIPLHGIGMLYEKSLMGDRLSDTELETLCEHFKSLSDLLIKSGPRFDNAFVRAQSEFHRLDSYRQNRMDSGRYNPGKDESDTLEKEDATDEPDQPDQISVIGTITIEVPAADDGSLLQRVSHDVLEKACQEKLGLSLLHYNHITGATGFGNQYAIVEDIPEIGLYNVVVRKISCGWGQHSDIIKMWIVPRDSWS